MLRSRDLCNRIYSGKQCVGFQVNIIDADRGKLMEATYRRDADSESTWTMQILFPRTRDKDTEVYNFGYTMPRSNLPLELIAATGMKYFQLYLKQEIQDKSALDFAIGELLEGM